MDNNDDDYWEIPENIDKESFDFDWLPPINDLPWIYQFGTIMDKDAGPRYVCAGAQKIKYVSEQIARVIIDRSKWMIDPDADQIDFDFSWYPKDEPPYKFIFKTGVAYNGGDAGIKWMEFPVPRVTYKPRPPLDIVYVSNGEVGEKERYDRLCSLSGRSVKWVRGVAGRENALRQAAQISQTDWFILFPAKLWADPHFDFNYQPQNKAVPLHYIFYALNPINGLEYGHQAAVCYNRQLVLETHDYGLDFTMSKPHTVVPIRSGIAQYNSDLLMTWRTAFREAVKLKASGDPESLERLSIWLSQGTGQHCEWSVIGAEDGVEYYKRVNGDHSELMRTFDWKWLKEFFTARYHNLSKNT